MAPTQVFPWASGKTKAAPKTTPKPRKRRRKMSPAAKGLATFWGALGLFLLGFAQIFEMSALLFVGATSMAASAATVWQQKHQSGGVPGPAVAGPNSAKPRGNAVPGGRRAKPGTAAPNCTRTSQPIDRCGCSARHVRTQDGVRRYKQAKRVGDPIGGGKVSTTKPAATSKQPRVPTTNNARPIPVGEPMRRVL
jgi:hypothetical protein